MHPIAWAFAFQIHGRAAERANEPIVLVQSPAPSAQSAAMPDYALGALALGHSRCLENVARAFGNQTEPLPKDKGAESSAEAIACRAFSPTTPTLAIRSP